MTLILVVVLSFDNEVRNNDSTPVQYISIENAEIPLTLGINLSKFIKNNDGTFIVGNELIPGTYKVELTDTTKIGCVEKYNSKEVGADNLIARYTFDENGYFIVENDDFLVKLQGVKITLQQNFYLFGL